MTNKCSLRRGFQVYREVCSSCHSLARVPWRALVGVSHTVDEAKAMAEESEYDDEPNDVGDIEKRPGKLSDYLPDPYPNEQAARAANQGAYPPDLSLMVKARHGGCDYIFALLTGYPDEPPAGAVVPEGLNFNPYFPGTGGCFPRPPDTYNKVCGDADMCLGIAMARVLYDGLVEYEDGTPATTSQMAKDVVEFLNWAAEPEMDQRKKMGMKVIIITTILTALSIWVKKYKWAPIKARKLVSLPLLYLTVTQLTSKLRFTTHQKPKPLHHEKSFINRLLLWEPGRGNGENTDICCGERGMSDRTL